MSEVLGDGGLETAWGVGGNGDEHRWGLGWGAEGGASMERNNRLREPIMLGGTWEPTEARTTTMPDISRPGGTSPRIVALEWGRIRIEGEPEDFKDAKLFPGGGREWDWNETATRHDPGVQRADVAELVEQGATVVVVGTGYRGRLGVEREAIEYLERRGIEAHLMHTEAAVKRYNELRHDESVGGLFHTTC